MISTFRSTQAKFNASDSIPSVSCSAAAALTERCAHTPLPARVPCSTTLVPPHRPRTWRTHQTDQRPSVHRAGRAAAPRCANRKTTPKQSLTHHPDLPGPRRVADGELPPRSPGSSRTRHAPCQRCRHGPHPRSSICWARLPAARNRKTTTKHFF